MSNQTKDELVNQWIDDIEEIIGYEEEIDLLTPPSFSTS